MLIKHIDYSVKRLHPNPQQFDHLLNDLFKDLKHHYDKQFTDSVLRLGDLILAMELMHVGFFINLKEGKTIGYV